MTRVWLRLLACAILGLCSCQSFGPPAPELEALLQVEATEGRRTKAKVRITSDWFNGEFRAVKVERNGAEPRVRFQLFPDLGGKLLDIVASPESVVAHWPHSGELQRTREALIGFLAVSFMESATPLRVDRVRGSRPVPEGTLLDVQPASRGLDLQVRATIDSGGELVRREYTLDGIGWVEEFQPIHRVHSRKFEWSFIEEESESLPRPADKLFELKAAGSDRP